MPKTPHRHRGLVKLALEITSKLRAKLWTENMRRRTLALLNEKMRQLVAAGEIEAGWSAVIVEIKGGADVQFAKA